MTRAGTGGALTYKGAYDEAGTLVREEMPGEVTRVVTTNALKDDTGLTYKGQVTPTTATTDPVTGEVTWTPGTPAPGTWFAWTTERDGLGRIVREYTGEGAGESAGEGAGFDGTSPGVPESGDTSHLPVGGGLAYDRQFSYTARGQLARVVDRTVNTPVGPIDPATTPTDAPGLYCQARSYGFNADGARTTMTVQQYNGGVCTGTASATSTRTYGVDSANRFTTGVTVDGGAPGGAYTYDGLGRQTVIPASDAPNYGSAITLGYYVDDLPASVTQGGVSTTFSLDVAGRRATQSTTGGGSNGSTTVRHYGDSSDNPGWSVTTPANGAALVTRYTDSIGGDLGASITGTGDASIGIIDPHDNTVTTVVIPAAQTSGTAATAVTGWARWSEYGSPAAPATVTGPLGYGWLGAKQRETAPDAAGLTLMGVRFYNWATGAFTSADPVPGGNDTSYGYPTDPINNNDITGQWGCGWCKKIRSKVASAARKVDTLLRQSHQAGPFGWRNYRPGLKWFEDGYARPHRIEWDRDHGWHYNPAANEKQGHKKWYKGLWPAGKAAARWAWSKRHIVVRAVQVVAYVVRAVSSWSRFMRGGGRDF